ncbi:MAG: hypothetical protein AAFZ87_03470, partial [Planctomycetota bacterium]
MKTGGPSIANAARISSDVPRSIESATSSAGKAGSSGPSPFSSSKSAGSVDASVFHVGPPLARTRTVANYIADAMT